MPMEIVVADGRAALVGGHNMWDKPYLLDNPVMNVSMKISSGLAAVDAYLYADNLWWKWNLGVSSLWDAPDSCDCAAGR